ncbi:MAG TPA: transposase [Candidatus Binatia bacterium]|nr:transposase [Candidatus Binatia bacterium]
MIQIYRNVIKFFERHKLSISSQHKRYLKHARRELARLYPTKQDQEMLEPYSDLILSLFLLDLEPLRPQLQAFYHPKPRGTPPRDPIQMFRSLLCLILSGQTLGFTKWVKILRSQPLFAALSGFEVGSPGIGTFYGLSGRLFPETTDSIIRQAIFKPKDSDKAPPPRPGIVKRLVTKLLDNLDKPLPAFPARRLNLLLKPFVLRSNELGLLSSSEAIDLAGDGTKFKTGARPSGRKLCDCHRQGIYRCQCARLYTDRFASWGWDSYRECFVYGHAFYELTAASSPFDLPIFILPTQAKEHDSASGVKALDRASKLYPELSFASFIGDSAHDNYPTYDLLGARSITPIIALNERHTGYYQLDGHFTTDKSGVPVCPKGETLVAGGFCPDRRRMKWRCPRAAHHCAKPCQCSPSAYGRVFYTKLADDPRLFTHPPRGSRAWKEAYKDRTSAERSHKRKKIDFHLEQARVRSRRQWAVRIFLMAICQHALAWVDLFEQSFG